MDIKNKYSLELQAIRNDLENLEKGNIYEIKGTPGVPSHYTIYKRLTKNLNDLLNKIENNQDGAIEYFRIFK